MQLTELAARFLAILVLDFKGDFIDVASRLGRDIWYHFSATDGFRLQCGPPFECDHYYMSWINQWTKVISAHCDFKFAEATLATVVRIAVNLLNDPLVHPLAWPSLRLIHQLLEILPSKLISKKDEYLRTAQQKVEYLLRIGGQLFDAEHGFDIIKHLILPKRCAVIDCTGLSSLLGQILVNMLALQVMFPRITKRQISQHTNFVLIIDEADTFCSDEASVIYPEGYNVLGQTAKQSRQFGIELVLGMTRLGRCSPFITSNVSYHLICNQSDPASVELATQTLLEPESRQLVASLKCGEVLFKEAMGPVPYGMLVKADHVPASDMLRPEKFDQHSYTPARSLKDIPGLKDKIDNLINEYNASIFRHQQTNKKTVSLTKNQRTFLTHMSLNEYEPINKLFERMGGLSPATQQKIIKKLENLKLIETKHIRTSKSPLRLGQLTKAGWDYLNDKSKFKPLRGDMVHTHACRLKQALDIKRGCEESICEFPYPNSTGFSDIGTTINGKLHCTEVVIGCDSNICQHVRSCFIDANNQVETLTIVTLLKSQHEQIRQKILSDPQLSLYMNSIAFVTLDDILKELYEK